MIVEIQKSSLNARIAFSPLPSDVLDVLCTKLSSTRPVLKGEEHSKLKYKGY